MANLSINLRLRPIRFAFLVRPDDGSRLLKIFQINTCLWGGKFNPIIPYFKHVPKWWNREGRRFESAEQIVNGYLNFFEPDFLVEAENGLSKDLGFHPERVIKLNDILIHSGDREGYGLSVNGIYGDLYKKEYQFTRRRKPNTIYIKPQDASFKNLSACLFGAFPTPKGLKYFEQNYVEVFDPKEIKLTGSALAKLYTSRAALAPLRVTQEYLDVDYQDHDLNPSLFVLKGQEPRDLIDFWNLSGIRKNIWPIPLEWIQDLSPFCKDFILRQHRPLPGNPHGVMIMPVVMFSRSIPEKDIDQIHKQHFWVDRKEANCIQKWYPSIWKPSPEFTFRTTRPILKADGKSYSSVVDLDKPSVNFENLSPEFAPKYGGHYRFANVAKLGGFGHKDQIATTFPCDYKNPLFPEFRLGREYLIPTTEGLVFFPRYKGISEHWDLLDGTKAINTWLNKQKIKASPSDAGRATQQVIQTLEGFWGVGKIARAGIVNLLNEMSRKPLTRSIHFDEFRQKIKASLGSSIWKYREFETLVERRAVELGLELKCSKCGAWGWHPIKGLGYAMTCDLCLQKLDFPITDPTNSKLSKWAYRVIGPFALPDYARGGYASALAIRFFSEVAGMMDKVDVTWSAGQELEFSTGQKLESDFILWHQRKQTLGIDYPTEIVFGETKSFGKEVFKEDEIENARLLAEKFPGAVFVFATMKEASDLSKQEISRIRKLAEWGRVYDREKDQSRAPVIVLTGTELFAPHSLEDAWKEKGGKHEQLIPKGYIRAENLRELANLTQQLYLGMPSYSEWLRRKWERRKAAFNKAQTKREVEEP